MKIRRRIDEKDLLKMLGIPSFRYMSKEKLASFVSALPDVDPDVAKKALEQFPDLSAAITEIVGRDRGRFLVHPIPRTPAACGSRPASSSRATPRCGRTGTT